MPHDFNKFFNQLIGNEGEYSDKKTDKGGKTIYGISIKNYPKEFLIVYTLWKDGKKELALSKAKEFYRSEFYNDLYDQLPEKLAFKLFDLSINMGKKTAIKLLQRTVGAKPDGIFGPQTLNACNDVYNDFIQTAEVYYKSLEDPDNEAGWLNRLHRELA